MHAHDIPRGRIAFVTQRAWDGRTTGGRPIHTFMLPSCPMVGGPPGEDPLMRQTTATTNHDKAARLHHPTIEGWLDLFGGPGFKAKRSTEGVTYVVTAI